MALDDVMTAVTADTKVRGKGDKKYVTFSIAEWEEMEKVYGKKIDPVHAKKLLQGIFSKSFNITKAGK